MDIIDVIWLGVTILAAIVEAAVPALVSIWFVPGGLLALVASLAGGSLALQVALFFLGYLAAMAVTASVAVQYTAAAAGFILGILGAISYDRRLRARGGLSFTIVRLF